MMNSVVCNMGEGSFYSLAPSITAQAGIHCSKRSSSSSISQPQRLLTQGRPVRLHASPFTLGPQVEGDGDLEPRQDRLELARKISWLQVVRTDEGDGPCPELLVGHGHDDGLVDPLQPAENLLYLLGLDVLAARDEEVVRASTDPQVAVIVQLTEVSRMEPAVRIQRKVPFCALDVARGERLAPDQDLPALGDRDLAVRQGAA